MIDQHIYIPATSTTFSPPLLVHSSLPHHRLIHHLLNNSVVYAALINDSDLTSTPAYSAAHLAYATSTISEAECPDGSLLDEPHVRIPLIAAYVIMFVICLLGNMFTILVICVHRSMRTSTNFFLANLAMADLLVSIFCILQNMFHLVGSTNGHWPLGRYACKLYICVLHLVPCTGIGILVCVSVEKYVAVLHPLLALKLLTNRFRCALMLAIWSTSLVFNLPYYFTTTHLQFTQLAACTRDMTPYGALSTREMVLISFVLWYCIPLMTIAFLYTRIGMVLWNGSLKPVFIRHSNNDINSHANSLNNYGNSSTFTTITALNGGSMHETVILGGKSNGNCCGAVLDVDEQQLAESRNGGKGGDVLANDNVDTPVENIGKSTKSVDGTGGMPSGTATTAIVIPTITTTSVDGGASTVLHQNNHNHHGQQTAQSLHDDMAISTSVGSAVTHQHSATSDCCGNLLESRKKFQIIRLLIAIVCSFAVLTLPHHARLIYVSWTDSQMCNGTASALLQPLSYLCLFFSSSVNPFLYAFMSRRFRSAVSDIIKCRSGHTQRKYTRTRTFLSDLVPSRSQSLTRLNGHPNATSANNTPCSQCGNASSSAALLLPNQLTSPPPLCCNCDVSPLNGNHRYGSGSLQYRSTGYKRQLSHNTTTESSTGSASTYRRLGGSVNNLLTHLLSSGNNNAAYRCSNNLTMHTKPTRARARLDAVDSGWRTGGRQRQRPSVVAERQSLSAENDSASTSSSSSSESTLITDSAVAASTAKSRKLSLPPTLHLKTPPPTQTVALFMKLTA